MAYVISKLSNDVEFASYADKNGISVKVGKIVIKGGANVAHKKTLEVAGGGLLTFVTDKELETLQKSKIFMRQMEQGFFKIIKDSKSKAENIAENMDGKDKSAQLTERDFTEKGQSAPKTSVETVAGENN